MGNISKHFSGNAQRQKLNEGPKSKALEAAGRISRKALRQGCMEQVQGLGRFRHKSDNEHSRTDNK